jgi:methanogenic corrinoid protein MtbC1
MGGMMSESNDRAGDVKIDVPIERVIQNLSRRNADLIADVAFKDAFIEQLVEENKKLREEIDKLSIVIAGEGTK